MSKLFDRTLRLYRDAYAGHPPEIWTLVILTFINRLGMMVLPFMTVYLTTILGFSFKEAGLMATAFGLGSLGGSFLGGKLHPLLGSRALISGSIAMGGIFLFLLQFTTSFYGIASLIFCAALFGESYRPAMSLAIAEHVPKNQTGRSFSLIRLAINMGMAAGPAIGGFVATYLSYRWLFVIDGTTCVLAGLYFVYASRNWTARVPTEADIAEAKAAGPALHPMRNRRFLLFLVATFLMGCGFVQWFHTVPLFMKTDWGFDERYIGIVMAFSSVIIAIFEMPAVHAVENAGKIRVYMRLGLALIGISFLPFYLPGSLIWCFLAMTVLTFGEIFVLPFNNALQIKISPDARRAEYMSWYWMTWSLVIITGPAVGLSMVSWIGFPLFWGCTMGLMALSFAINFLLRLE